MKLLAIGVGLAVLGAAASRSQDLPEWVRQIARIKFQERQNLAHIPNYVCRETVKRSRTRSRSAPFEELDTLRFEVAHVGVKDLLALPGAKAFEDVNLTKFFSTGMLGTGEFASIANGLFVADVSRFTPRQKGDGILPVPLGFDFEIAEFRSGWEISAHGVTAIVGSRGTIWVDPETLELPRIEEHAMDLPGALGWSAVEITIDYARMRIGTSNVLLPKTAETLVTEVTGEQTRNLVEFSGCREFVSDSTITFETPVTPPVVKKK